MRLTKNTHSEQGYQVYRLNECDWYAGMTLEDAVQAAMEDTDMDSNDVMDHGDPKPEDLNMNRLWIKEPPVRLLALLSRDANPIVKAAATQLSNIFYRMTFRKALRLYLNQNLERGFFFCTTEW